METAVFPWRWGWRKPKPSWRLLKKKKADPLSRQRGNGRALPASAGAVKQVMAPLLGVDSMQGPRPVFFNKLCSQLLGRKEAKPSAGPACQVFVFQVMQHRKSITF